MTSPLWRPLPPLREADSITALGAWSGRALAGSAAGLFRRDGVEPWKRLDLSATEVQAIALDSTTNTVAVGAGGSVDVSRDGGTSWTRAELDTIGRVTALGMAAGTLLAGTDRDGTFLSNNGGASWHSFGLDGQMVLAVCGDDLAGTDTGLWQRDPATGWRKLALEGVCTAIARCGDALLAGTEDDGLLRSIDGGRTWAGCSGVQEGINAVATSGRRALAGTSSGHVFLSEDGGGTWKELPSLSSAVMAVALDDDRLLAGCYRTGLFELHGNSWHPLNDGLESTNAIDLLAFPEGLVVASIDGLRRWAGDSWQTLDLGLPGEVRAAGLTAAGELLVATTAGLFGKDGQLGDLHDVNLIRAAANGDLAVLTEDALHLRLGQRWTQLPRSERERTIDVAFTPSYPDDDGVLLCTLRQGTRTSVVRYGPRTEEVDRLFDYDAGSRWLSIALPPDYRADARRPAGFFVGTGGSLFRPSWPGDTWQRDVLHDPNAIVLSLALSPAFAEDKTVAVGTTTGPVLSHNAGLLWTNEAEGLQDVRCLKLVYDREARLFCLTPTRIYELGLRG